MANDRRRRQYGENLHHYARAGLVAWYVLGIVLLALVGADWLARAVMA